MIFYIESLPIKKAAGLARHGRDGIHSILILQFRFKRVEVFINVVVINRNNQGLLLVITELFVFYIAHLLCNNEGADDQKNRYAELNYYQHLSERCATFPHF